MYVYKCRPEARAEKLHTAPGTATTPATVESKGDLSEARALGIAETANGILGAGLGPERPVLNIGKNSLPATYSGI